MKSYSYKTIESATEALYKEKGSKFLAFAYPVADENEVKEKLHHLRKQFFDASHHCYAYRLGYEGEKSRANDDGEPGHSAGDPILGQIRSIGLTQVLVVVVRYFGGVKLGVGGLIAAYRSAAEQVLTKAKIVENDITGELTIAYDYPATAEVMKMISDFSMTILDQKFESYCEMRLAFPLRYEAKIAEKIALLSQLGRLRV